MTDVVISAVRPVDVGEILTVQRAAYVTEAQLYPHLVLPALTETYREMAAQVASCLALKATRRHRIVGACRARVDGEYLHIGRLAVAPDQQGQGIGTMLLREIERQAPASVRRYALFTGHLSVANIRLYERLGYHEVRREPIGPSAWLVHLEKAAARDAIDR